MKSKRYLHILLSVLVILSLTFGGPQVRAQSETPPDSTSTDTPVVEVTPTSSPIAETTPTSAPTAEATSTSSPAPVATPAGPTSAQPGGFTPHGTVTNADRKAAAQRAAQARGNAQANGQLSAAAVPTMNLIGPPDYFGTTPNYANSPLPVSIGINGDGSGASAMPSIETSTMVNHITLNNAGSGYTSAPGVVFTGGGGSGAAATAILSTSISNILVTAGGSGYTNPVVSFTGGGSGATATATIVGGVITGITVVTPGSGYTILSKVVIADPTGSGATASLVFSLASIAITNGGTGYTTSPSISFTGGGGSGAAATAILSGSGGNGAIAYVTVTNGGSGYTYAATTVTAIGGGGSGAVLQPIIDLTTGSILAINVISPGSGYDTVPGIRKFVDSLPGLGASSANDLGQYLPIAVPDTHSYPGSGTFGTPSYSPASDYYVIALVQYTQKLNSDLPPTTLRGYVQLETANVTGKHIALSCNGATYYEVDAPQYLGPTIIAGSYDPTKAAGVAGNGKPTRVKFHNCLPTGPGGDLFIPVDTTVMGAGPGPVAPMGTDCSVNPTPSVCYSQNRATLHLHGGNTPWISDGTPDQWTTPATETTAYPEGVSVYNVPDMDGGVEPVGTMTFYYTNEQSARLMFYHDHSYGITRLNVYAGEAAGYLVTDPVEQTMINGGTIPGTNTTVSAGTIPATQVPLIIQDKTFVPSLPQMVQEDPTWKWGTTAPGTVNVGDLWFPHVYMPNQNPFDINGANAVGRWDYGPWFWPPFVGLTHGEVANPLYPSLTNPVEGPNNPGTPNPSLVPEGFMDSMLVNGTVYPFLNVTRQAYRFRILNASNDRTLNLQLYCAKSNGTMWNINGALQDGNAGEVNMVPADPNTGLPSTWPTDGRDGGVPDPTAVGPSFIQIGTEGGLMPQPAVLPNNPIGYIYNRRDITVLNVSTKTLMLGPAERADVIVDFSQVPSSCSNIILYNDAPAPVPAFDSRNDYYTGDPDQTSSGGAPTTQLGYGPNTRTVMQIRVSGALGTAYNLAALQADLPVAFAASQPAPIVPQAVYNTAYGANYPTDAYVRIQDTTMAFTPAGTSIDSIALTNGGAGYTSAPTVSLVGGTGKGATATATVIAGAVTAVTVTNAGTGYMVGGTSVVFSGGGSPTVLATAMAHISTLSTSINRVTVTSQGAGYTSAPKVDLVGGAGSGATAVATLTHSLDSITVTSPGSGYNTPGVVIIDPTGTGATATATVTAGAITAVTVTNAGSGYTAPVIEFTGDGSGASAAPVLSATNILSIAVTNGGSGYSTGLPTVILTGGGYTTAATAVADVSVLIGLQPKAIQELFTTDYGRMNATLGVEIPNTTGINQTTIPLGYIDPATELVNASTPMTPIGTLGDGTQIWKITHNGVDTHAIHFHLFNVELINRVGWDGMVKPPEANEVGWKDTVRMNPLEDAIVALRPIIPIVPWPLPNSVRSDDVTMPANSTRTGVIDPLNAAVNISNNPINFGWEYVWHCHLLGHEENDMMRPILVAVPPEVPSSLVATAGGANVNLAWNDNSLMSTSFIVQRANDPAFTAGLTQFAASKVAGIPQTYIDTTAAGSTLYYYRILAANTVGGTSGAYPNATALSAPSNVVKFSSTPLFYLTAISPHAQISFNAVLLTTSGAAFHSATIVTVTHGAVDSGWSFAGWSGACTGTGTCTVTMNSDKTVTALFTPNLPTISGNAGIGGATITYTGGGGPITADSTGNYSFTAPASPWTGSVTPTMTGYIFTPLSRTYTAVTANQVAQNYTAAIITYTISGHVDTLGVSLSYLVGSQLMIVNNDAFGNYTLTVPYNWSGTVIPYRTGVIFIPPSLPYTNVLANLINQNYVRQPPSFVDVPYTYSETLGGVSYNLFPYIQALYDHGFTNGCLASPLSYCPTRTLNRAEMAKFLLNVIHGAGYNITTLPAHPVFPLDNWAAVGSWAQPWAEELYIEGLTNGCQALPLMYCPLLSLPLEQAAKFGLAMKYGPAYIPPPATGTVFADLTDTTYWSTPWVEQAYKDGLVVACGTSLGKPMICPSQSIDRGWTAYLIVKAKNIAPVPYP